MQRETIQEIGKIILFILFWGILIFGTYLALTKPSL